MPSGKPKNNKKITCQYCKEKYNIDLSFSVKGLTQHINRTCDHLPIEQYVEKYGEFRTNPAPTYKEEKKIVKCLECGELFHSTRRLWPHVRKVHQLTNIEYTKKHIFKGKPQLCKCGCGQEVKIFYWPPYRRDYIIGHDTRHKQVHLGSKRSESSKNKMKRAAIKRIKRGDHPYYQYKTSDSQIELITWIKSVYTGSIVENEESILDGYELDVYIPEKKLAIELNGEKFHSVQAGKDRQYHITKTKRCNQQGIHLMHIWYSNWYKKKDLCKSMIANKLGLTKTVVYARKTKVVSLDSGRCVNFLEKNHLQGTAASSIRYGLVDDKNNLVAVMTFSKVRKGLSKTTEKGYELIRFCNQLNTRVVGGASKLFKAFIREHNPVYVVSYAKRDWADGELYKKLGFNFKHFTEPGYFYHKSRIHYSRVNFQKHKLVKRGYDPAKTELEIMTKEGYDKVYDTGNFKFVWIN